MSIVMKAIVDDENGDRPGGTIPRIEKCDSWMLES
jgi:hypothetical protein